MQILKLFASALRNSLHFIPTKRLVSNIFVRLVKSHWLLIRCWSSLWIFIVLIFVLTVLIIVWFRKSLLVGSIVGPVLIRILFLLVIRCSLIRWLSLGRLLIGSNVGPVLVRVRFLLVIRWLSLGRLLGWLTRILSITRVMTISTLVSKRTGLTVFDISARYFALLEHY